eukprot:1032947-Pleurochrysis_carterae.AAC.1
MWPLWSRSPQETQCSPPMLRAQYSLERCCQLVRTDMRNLLPLPRALHKLQTFRAHPDPT